jgi:hypothetical protein
MCATLPVFFAFSVKQIESVLLFVVKKTVLVDFMREQTIDFQLLLDRVIMPFFQLRTRILQPRQFFLIGDI